MLLSPTLEVHLFAPRYGKCVFRHILRNGRAGRDVTSPTNGNRRHQVAIAANKGVVLDGSAVFSLPS